MTSSTPTPADMFRQMAEQGQTSLDDQMADKGGLAYLAVQRLFAQVKAGKIEVTVLDQLADWADNPSQGSPTSQQPAALGSSTQGGSQPTPVDLSEISETDAYSVLQSSDQISNGVKAALRRILNPRDPNPIGVDDDGTPTKLADATAQRDTFMNERDSARNEKRDAERELAKERDPNKNGSLAWQLAEAQAAAATPPDMVEKAAIQDAYDAIKGGWDRKTEGRMNSDHTVLKRPQDASSIDSGLEQLNQLLS